MHVRLCQRNGVDKRANTIPRKKKGRGLTTIEVGKDAVTRSFTSAITL